MKKAYIDPKKCDRSPFCPAKRVCPVQAITQEKNSIFSTGPAKVDPEKCIGCGKCLNFCPGQAITMR
ncbi:4Fe-4S ferredoxin [Anoxybacter fermentans]|uniref:4Fe-4S ferredoxin n=1 Tax=Anoxybacter fermentans TaxID=1323375 RepID=A0A3S9SW46_9FIRM|nr:4Fe-4S dicluster domain-containing protein [Anoxybacter fermentans]AZR72460.1 4Fe-4S ferredoxin [Anoxybacter fermentans]